MTNRVSCRARTGGRPRNGRLRRYRLGAVAIAGSLALAGCGTAAGPEPTPSESRIRPSEPVSAPDGTPHIDGFTLVFAKEYSAEEGPGADLQNRDDEAGGAGESDAGLNAAALGYRQVASMDLDDPEDPDAPESETPSPAEPSSPSGPSSPESPSPEPEPTPSVEIPGQETPSDQPTPSQHPGGSDPNNPSVPPSDTPSSSGDEGSEQPQDSGTPHVDGAVIAGHYLLAYANDAAAVTHQVTVYDLQNGEREWSRIDPGLLDCYPGDPAICMLQNYTDGTWAESSVSSLNAENGNLETFEVGSPGTFAYVGVSEQTAYFLTWDGTHAVHMTGFDPTGAPVIDKNLRVDIPDPAAVPNIESWISNGRALISVPGSEPGIYVADANAFANYALSVPCISASDGMACTSQSDPSTLIGIDNLGRQVWEQSVAGSELIASGRVTASLSELQGQLDGASQDAQDTPQAGEAARAMLVASGDHLEQVNITGSRLDVGQRGTVSVGSGSVEGLDLTHDAAIVSVADRAEGFGEEADPQLTSSILVGPDGQILSQLAENRREELAAGNLSGQTIHSHTFQWQGDSLVYTDEVSGIVAVYQAN